ncbi:MAG TPA: methylmalonyl-CoA mutase family protein [Candidatus Polarisedimenticolia bacterium]|jgi:methylmalonyl-CoA mutase N-terminal domain/subunit|nr:methylmalonyl-CoA mutase family protein [Candidatus Polarisedimenticolia bacterium]
MKRHEESRGARRNSSGIDIQPLYTAADCRGIAPETDIGFPGEYPFTRGIQPAMYRSRLWTMRQYAGFGSAKETNLRLKFLLDHGQTGLSVAFDLPTQMGYDSDHPAAEGEVGKVGVAVSTLEDMELLLDGIPLDRVSTSMTINATAAILLCFYVAAAARRGIAPDRLSGTVQNDVLKEYMARGTYIYPPQASLRIATDLFAYCRDRLPLWNSISISGYHIREAGATAVQEIAFTLANGVEYLDAARRAGLEVDAIAPRISFFFNAHNDLFEEVAKFRAARRLWARIMKERFGARRERSLLLRFHAQTGGSTLTAQQVENNVVRVTYQALAAILGGTQSLHTNSMDEALSLPTEQSAALALRTQQILASETGVPDTVDPLGGSYYVEALTSRIEEGAQGYLDRIDRMGGVIPALESGFIAREIQEAAYRTQRAVESGEQRVVGVNCHRSRAGKAPRLHRIDPAVAREQLGRLARFKRTRDAAAARQSLADLERRARGTENLVPAVLAAVESRATLGEVSDVLRRVFGSYRPEVAL